MAGQTGLSQTDAEGRVNQAIAQSSEAIAGARHAAVILTFMIAASLMLGAAVAWLAPAFGGQHRDGAVAHHFWRRWEVDRMFFIHQRAWGFIVWTAGRRSSIPAVAAIGESSVAQSGADRQHTPALDILHEWNLA